MSLLVLQAELGVPCSTLGSAGGQQPSLSLTSAAPLWTVSALSLPTARPLSGWALVLPVQVPPPLLWPVSREAGNELLLLPVPALSSETGCSKYHPEHLGAACVTMQALSEQVLQPPSSSSLSS